MGVIKKINGLSRKRQTALFADTARAVTDEPLAAPIVPEAQYTLMVDVANQIVRAYTYDENGDIIAYDIPNRTLDLVGIDGTECGAEQAAKILQQRSKTEDLVPRPPRKGLYQRYTSLALSAMEGAGY